MLSYSEKQAWRNSHRIRQQIEFNPWLQWLWPKTLKARSFVWNNQFLEFSNGCTLETFGFGSSVRGGHYHKIFIDDPCKDEGVGSMSPEQQWQFFKRVIIPARRKGGQIVVTGNPVDLHDFLEYLENNPKFFFKAYPAIDAEDNPLWPEQYGYEDLMEIKGTIDWDDFEREYMLRRVAAGDVEFRPEWCSYYDPRDIFGMDLYKIMTIDRYALTPTRRYADTQFWRAAA